MTSSTLPCSASFQRLCLQEQIDGGVDVTIDLPQPVMSTLFHTLIQKGLMGKLAAGYLAYAHKLPATILAGPGPTLHVAHHVAGKKMEEAFAALDRVLVAEDMCTLIDHVVIAHQDAPPVDSIKGRRPLSASRSQDVDTVHVAWFCNLISADELPVIEPSFAHLNTPELEQLIEATGPLIGPILIEPTQIQIGSRSVVFHPIVIPMTSAAMKHALDHRQMEVPRRLLREGVEAAQSLGCEVISLGQYTSILSHNGQYLSRFLPEGIGLTTGNSYTVHLALEAVEREMAAKGWEARNETVMVVGALGNIGRVCAEMLAPRFGQTLLLGRDRSGSVERLREAADALPRCEATTEIHRASEARVIIAASSGVDAVLTPENLPRNAIVCDVSVPAAVSPEVGASRPDVTVIRGGLAQLPEGESMGIPNFPLPDGRVFGCMAEGLLLGVDGLRSHEFTGSIDADQVTQIGEMAARHGFTLADPHAVELLGNGGRHVARA